MATHAIGKTFVNSTNNVRQCSECKRLFELNGTNFGIQRYTMRQAKVKTSRWHTMCRSCWNLYERKRYAEKKAQQKCKQTREYYFQRQYGLTTEEVENLYEQGCMICGTKERGINKNSLHIDHCHKTGRVRGCLCVRCNQGLGNFLDNPNLLYKAIEYLNR